MAQKNRTMAAWVRRRARDFMRSFGTPRHKAVRYAADDWKAMQGAKRSCEALGVCQREAARVFRGADQKDCKDPGQCIFRTPPIAQPTKAMQDFRRFLSRATGAAQ